MNAHPGRWANGKGQTEIFRPVFLLVVFAITSIVGLAQIPSPIVTPAVQKLSKLLSKNLESFKGQTEISRENREQAYAKLMEAQRFLWRANTRRIPAAFQADIGSARNSLQKALELDPMLAEGYTALAELAINPRALPNDVDEAIAFAAMAVRLNNDNFGAHRLLARLYTYKSNLNNGSLDPEFASRAIAEWMAVARLDPRNAEAWAFLSEFYDKSDRTSEKIESLRKWLASSSPLDRQFYQKTMKGQDLSPESATEKLASALLKAGRLPDAIEVLSQEIADEPENTEAIEQLKAALQRADAKTAASAIQALQQAVYANPGNLPLLELLATMEAKAGKIEDAVNVLNSASQKMMPSDRAAASSLQVSMGDIYAKAERYVDAAATYERALSFRGLDQAQSLNEDEREFALSLFDKLITAYQRANRIAEARAAILRARKLLGRDDLFSDRKLVSINVFTSNFDCAVLLAGG